MALLLLLGAEGLADLVAGFNAFGAPAKSLPRPKGGGLKIGGSGNQ